MLIRRPFRLIPRHIIPNFLVLLPVTLNLIMSPMRDSSPGTTSIKLDQALPGDKITLATRCIPAGPGGRGRNLFGVINNQGEHYADEWAKGVRATVFELHWRHYEPQDGVYDQAYIDHAKQILSQLKSAGWYIQLVPGYHYVPDWVFTQYPDMFYRNQFGENYDPDANTAGDYRVLNAAFNPQARALISRYLARVFQDFNPSDFDSVRVGGSVLGEIRYPPPDWNGHPNSYWAFDVHAQNPAESSIPASVVGWRPGIDPNPGSQGRGQLIVNPGFEQVHPSFSVLAWSPEDEILAELTPQDVHTGSQALKLTISTPHRIHQFVRVEPNVTYQFGGWLKSTDSAKKARLLFTQYDANNQPVPDVPFVKLESNAPTWSDKSGSLTTASTTRFLKVELDGNAPGAYYFDDLWLKRAGETNVQERDINVPLAFYDWYVQALTNYQNWQIAEIRKYTSTQLDLVYAGKGLMPNHLTDALTNDLIGDSWSESSSALYSGSLYDRHVAGLQTLENIALYLTGIEDPPADQVDDTSPYPSQWSAARWLASLAQAQGLIIWGENSGGNNKDQMQLATRRMLANGYLGLLWGFESELYANPNPQGFATIQDYAAEIARYNPTCRFFLPLIGEQTPQGIDPRCVPLLCSIHNP